MWQDPIVEEIHAIRRRIARDCGYDMARIMALLRKKEAEHAGRPKGRAKRAQPRLRRRGSRAPAAT